ncbi:related to RING finger protein YKR017C [Saccharomycodes ludwigii]|uniref:RBR-type E3 ubiquitin transferase n=1 Tax=Saccharomycodes ludwigii TaxID=36035 RepID=A0A376B8X3_9ASCO|nr:hypothetical protein SCDLUD_003597 [Saccharomycodes ludwigii]KAH3900605.1 hypothetical protein SCDLUD_003597 [Saccharomycodes ludwigii]SSD61061.1 related to RING finger protein YKR017C [Saccharomycodes ludwigii]
MTKLDPFCCHSIGSNSELSYTDEDEFYEVIDIGKEQEEEEKEEEEEEEGEDDGDTDTEEFIFENSDSDSDTYSFESQFLNIKENVLKTSKNLSPKSSTSNKHSINDVKVDYDCLNTLQLYDMLIESKIRRLKPIFKISETRLLNLLAYFDWNEDRLIERYTENKEDTLSSCGINIFGSDNGNDIKNVIKLEAKKSYVCPICCEDNLEWVFYLKTCKHHACQECYQRYIKDEINKSKLVKCMNCDNTLNLNDLDLIMGDKDDGSRKLLEFSIRSFITKHSDQYKWCPFADCDQIIHVKDTCQLVEFPRYHISPYVKCNNDHNFCFQCGREKHAPADCRLANNWIKKADKESATLNWVFANTKECPRCSVNIEKNGGCNHMICGGCKYEFCWVCEQDWEPHKNSFFNCIKYEKGKVGNNVEDENSDSNKTKNGKLPKDFQKYKHYYRLFSEHEQSAKLDMKLYAQIEKKIQSMQETVGISWIEGQFLQESINNLINARTALKWSFALSYYSDQSHNLTKIFEDNQLLLASNIEELSQLFTEKDPRMLLEMKLKCLNKAQFVKARMEALIECGRELLSKGICS